MEQSRKGEFRNDSNEKLFKTATSAEAFVPEKKTLKNSKILVERKKWLNDLAKGIAEIQLLTEENRSDALVTYIENTFKPLLEKNPVSEDRIEEEMHYVDSYKESPERLQSFLRQEYIQLVGSAGEEDPTISLSRLEGRLDQALAEANHTREIRKKILLSKGKESVHVKDLIKKIRLESGELLAQRERFCEIYSKEHKPKGFFGRIIKKITGGQNDMSTAMSVATLGYDRAIKLKLKEIKDTLAGQEVSQNETEDAINDFIFEEQKALDTFAGTLPDNQYHAFIERGKKVINTAREKS